MLTSFRIWPYLIHSATNSALEQTLTQKHHHFLCLFVFVSSMCSLNTVQTKSTFIHECDKNCVVPGWEKKKRIVKFSEKKKQWIVKFRYIGYYNGIVCAVFFKRRRSLCIWKVNKTNKKRRSLKYVWIFDRHNQKVVTMSWISHSRFTNPVHIKCQHSLFISFI